MPSSSCDSGSALAREAEQDEEQVDEIQVDRQCAHTLGGRRGGGGGQACRGEVAHEVARVDGHTPRWAKIASVAPTQPTTSIVAIPASRQMTSHTNAPAIRLPARPRTMS